MDSTLGFCRAEKITPLPLFYQPQGLVERAVLTSVDRFDLSQGAVSFGG
jgi:hypothetical protein